MTITKYIRPQDIAEALGWDRETVYVKLRKGDIPGFKMGGDWFVEPEDWDRYVAQQKAAAADKLA